jgi:hypothetical protein
MYYFGAKRVSQRSELRADDASALATVVATWPFPPATDPGKQG